MKKRAITPIKVTDLPPEIHEDPNVSYNMERVFLRILYQTLYAGVCTDTDAEIVRFFKRSGTPLTLTARTLRNWIAYFKEHGALIQLSAPRCRPRRLIIAPHVLQSLALDAYPEILRYFSVLKVFLKSCDFNDLEAIISALNDANLTLLSADSVISVWKVLDNINDQNELATKISVLNDASRTRQINGTARKNGLSARDSRDVHEKISVEMTPRFPSRFTQENGRISPEIGGGQKNISVENCAREYGENFKNAQENGRIPPEIGGGQKNISVCGDDTFPSGSARENSSNQRDNGAARDTISVLADANAETLQRDGNETETRRKSGVCAHEAPVTPCKNSALEGNLDGNLPSSFPSGSARENSSNPSDNGRNRNAISVLTCADNETETRRKRDGNADGKVLDENALKSTGDGHFFVSREELGIRNRKEEGGKRILKETTGEQSKILQPHAGFHPPPLPPFFYSFFHKHPDQRGVVIMAAWLINLLFAHHYGPLEESTLDGLNYTTGDPPHYVLTPTTFPAFAHFLATRHTTSLLHNDPLPFSPTNGFEIMHHFRKMLTTYNPDTPPEDSLAVREYQAFFTCPLSQHHHRLITDRITNIDLWKTILNEWSEQRWNPQNVTGMLERYHRDSEAISAMLTPLSPPPPPHPMPPDAIAYWKTFDLKGAQVAFVEETYPDDQTAFDHRHDIPSPLECSRLLHDLKNFPDPPQKT